MSFGGRYRTQVYDLTHCKRFTAWHKEKPHIKCGLVDDIGLEPMTFRTSKEAPSGNQAPEGRICCFWGIVVSIGWTLLTPTCRTGVV